MNDEISRIAGRMVHRADATLEFLEDVAARKRLLERRTDAEDSGRATKLEDLNDRADRLARAANDYRKAEKVLRAFPELLRAAQDFEAMTTERDSFGKAKPRVGLAHEAIRKAEEALK